MASLKELDEQQEKARQKLRRKFRQDLRAVLDISAKLEALKAISDEEWQRAENGA